MNMSLNGTEVVKQAEVAPSADLFLNAAERLKLLLSTSPELFKPKHLAKLLRLEKQMVDVAKAVQFPLVKRRVGDEG